MKRVMRWLLAAMLMAGTASPALAAANLECVDAGMTDAQRDDIHVRFEAGQDLDDAILEIVRTCGVRHGWSEAAQRHAVMHTIGVGLRRGLFRSAPITPAQIDLAEAAFNRAFNEAEVRAMLASDMGDDAAQRLAAAFMEAGVPTDQRTAEWLGSYMAAVQLEKYSRIDFTAA